MTDLIICHHTNADLQAIADIESLSINPPWSFKAISDFSKYETSRILVAKCNNMVVSYITYSVVVDEMQIANIATHPDFRRLGIAKMLLSSLFEEAKNGNICVITLEVRHTNTPAICLYKKCGFSEVGKRKNYYKNPVEDAILMNLAL